MSVLAWLFGLGALAVAFPLLFHLIRRTPKGRVPFSSLMFVRPSPPRLTRRSRLENLFLLTLRMAAIALIAAAFMRPFLRDNVNLTFADVPGKKIAVLLDTSASMQRGDLWSQALDRVKKIISNSSDKDDMAIYTFDSKLTLRKPFGLQTVDGDFLSQNQLAGVQPAWNSSDLGTALASLADELDQNSEGDDSKLQIIVVSDMQAGSSITSLQNYQWPPKVKVDFERVGLSAPSNAMLELLPNGEGDVNREKVIVKNSKDSVIDQFEVAWSGDTEKPVSFYVAPGTSKILAVPRQVESFKSDQLVLTGDAAEFDNQYFVVPPNQQTLFVAYLGDETAADPDQMLYYFEHCLMETPARVVKINSHDAENEFVFQSGVSPELVVVTRAVSELEQQAINDFLNSNGTVFFALHEPEMLASTRQWTQVDKDARFSDGTSDNYAMLVDINFSHPVLQPFAGPRFNDFTQIRFWKHLQTGVVEGSHIIANFDSGYPAFWHVKRQNGGDIYVLGTGWQPSTSQLALSSKFLPIINRLMELASRVPQVPESQIIGQTLHVPREYSHVESNDLSFDLVPDQPVHEQICTPGVYQFTNPANPTTKPINIAVNLDPAESDTDIMPLDQLAAFEVGIGRHVDAQTELEKQRQLHDIELESRQKLWKWLIVSALGLLIVESFWAGRTDRLNLRNEKILAENVA